MPAPHESTLQSRNRLNDLSPLPSPFPAPACVSVGGLCARVFTYVGEPVCSEHVAQKLTSDVFLDCASLSYLLSRGLFLNPELAARLAYPRANLSLPSQALRSHAFMWVPGV